MDLELKIDEEFINILKVDEIRKLYESMDRVDEMKKDKYRNLVEIVIKSIVS